MPDSLTGRPETRVLPALNHENRAFWTGGAQGQLMIMRCRACRRWFHPPAPVCFRCRSTDVGPEPASGRATVASFTINHHQWFPGFAPPYVVAIVELEEDGTVRLTTNLVGLTADDVRIGLRVRVSFEPWDDVWIPVFQPATVGEGSELGRL
jgi:uncharacterized protein